MTRMMFIAVPLLFALSRAGTPVTTLDKSWTNEVSPQQALTQVQKWKEPATAGSFKVEMRGFEPLTS
jgi:hypothetical protein